jgi:glucose-1-phosphate thymidylyltransferase
MKGIILAGGKGTRLYPLTKVCNKHLLPVGPYPMIYYPLMKVRQAGITDVLIVTGKEDVGDFARLLGGGSEFQLNITYRVQEKAGGIAEALFLGKDFVGTSPFVVILGDNLFEADLSPFVKRFTEGTEQAYLLLKEVNDPHHFGIAELNGGRIVAIEEKPLKPKSRYAVTGIYLYRTEVFDVISNLSPSPRGELEITEVNNHFVHIKELTFDILPGWWHDAGTLPSFFQVNQEHHSLNFPSNSSTNPS